MGGEQLPSNILRIDSAPHEWLFPRVSAAIHHGGAGTTASSLRAGVPAIIVPHLGDQPFWGKRVEALGVGPRAIPRRRLTASSLAEAIRRATSDAEMKRRAAELGEKIRAERGTARAADLIEEHLRH
jgi:UDP:flavonoid glycosyltransferase YjiC (YdhE family)